MLPKAAPDWAFFLDIDGTLLEFADRPELVFVGPGLRRLLRNLHRASGGALALVSGRSLADMDALFDMPHLPAAGQHGVERRNALGELFLRAKGGQALRPAAELLQAFVARNPGLLLEDKGHSLALHYRRGPHLKRRARRACDTALEVVGPGFVLQPGNMVLELLPATSDKGQAIEAFMGEPPFAGRVPVFVGDDTTDERGFDVVNRLGGHTIKVGEGRSIARWSIAEPYAVRAWLDAWISRFGQVEMERA